MKEKNQLNINKIKQTLKNVKHPAIEETLFNLGILKNIELKGNKLTITLAFPFANIPIKDFLIEKIKEPLSKLGLDDINIKTTVMDKNELQKFLILEQKHWKG